MCPEISAFGLKISTYWLMFFCGLVGMAVVCWVRTKYYCFSGAEKRGAKGRSIVFTVLLAVFGLLGTKILYILENFEDTLANGLSLGGQSFFGALLLLPFVVPIYGKFLGMSKFDSLDFCAPAVILILMFMRLGCFMNGCCGGIYLGSFQVPAQLFEAIGDAMIFSALLYCEETGRFRGRLYPFLMLWYGMFRFLLEFIRDTDSLVAFFTMGQLLSIVSCLVALAWIARLKNEKKE